MILPFVHLVQTESALNWPLSLADNVLDIT